MNVTEKLADTIREELKSKGYSFSEKDTAKHATPTEEMWMLVVHYSD